MRVARLDTPAGPRWARLDDRDPIGAAAVALDRAPWEGGRPTGEALSPPHRWLAPVAPSKIVAVGSNYPKHAAEMGNVVPEAPRLFLKPPSALVGHGESIEIPPVTVRVDPEGELAAVIGAPLRRADPAACLAAVLGYTALNDVTCRDFQKQDGLFTRAKGFDTFCPVGPWIDTSIDPSDLAIETWVNGELRAAGRTRDMTFPLGALLSFISHVMTLLPGDVVSTGTPPGVAPIHAGDLVSVRIEGLPPLENPVIDREDRRP